MKIVPKLSKIRADNIVQTINLPFLGQFSGNYIKKEND